MDKTDDPFAGITKYCVTAADEEELRNCPFAVEFENFPESFASQLSSPANSVERNSAHKNENIQTPQEHQYTQTCISDDQRPTAVDLPAYFFKGKGTAGGYCDGKEAQVRVDLGKDNDDLGSREITVNGYHGGDGLERINQVEYSEGDADGPLRKRIRVCEKNLRMHSSQITDLEVEEVVRDEVVDGIRINRNNVEFALTESKDGENDVVHGKKHANGITGSSTGGVDRGRRELPYWMRGGEEDVGRKAMKKEQFKDIIEVTVEILGKKGENKDVDFLETAKRHDMLFPRPRWWSPELFVD
ncbi:unnamed protein product [Withania somnifera]